MNGNKKNRQVIPVAVKAPPKKEIKIEYLYLDLKTCDRCIGTDSVLEKVIKELSPAFSLAGYRISYQKTEIATQEDAIARRFLSSPTVRVNGNDICTEVEESDCGCCGEIAGVPVDCRVFSYEGKRYSVAPKAMLAEAILKNAFLAEKEDTAPYELPQNLRTFFQGKKNRNPAPDSRCE